MVAAATAAAAWAAWAVVWAAASRRRLGRRLRRLRRLRLRGQRRLAAASASRYSARLGTPRPFTRRSMSSISRPFSTGWTDALASWRGAVATIMRVAIARAYRLGVPVVLLVLRALAVLERVGLGRKAKHRGREARVGSESLTTEYPGACGKGAEAMRRWWHGKHRAGRRRAGRRGAGTRRGEAGVA